MAQERWQACSCYDPIGSPATSGLLVTSVRAGLSVCCHPKRHKVVLCTEAGGACNGEMLAEQVCWKGTTSMRQPQGIMIDGGLTAATKLYRYMGLSQFMCFVENQQTYLTRVQEWEDTWETPVSRLPTKRDDGRLEYSMYSATEDLYGQCWSLLHESDALWRIYSPHKEGLLIETTAAKFDLLQDIRLGVLGKVSYYDHISEVFEASKRQREYPSVMAEALYKRRAFEHEQEVRLVVFNHEEFLGRRYQRCSRIFFPLSAQDFVEGITIDPRASDWFIETVRSYCKRAGFGFVPKVSGLYRSSVFEGTGIAVMWVPVEKDGESGAVSSSPETGDGRES